MAEKGRLQAQRENHERKPLKESLREHIGKAIDRIDPLEAAAVIALTPMMEITLEQLIKAGSMSINEVAKIANMFGGLITVLGPPGTPLHDILMGIILGVEESTDPKVTAAIIDNSKLYLWALAFIVSFCLIRWGPAIVSSGFTGVKTVIGLLGFGI